MPTFYVIPEKGGTHVTRGESMQVRIVHPTQHVNVETALVQSQEQYEEQKRLQAEQGRKAWTYLHTTDDPPEIAIPKFESMIPQYGCGCVEGYRELKIRYPFDLSSRDAFFVSTVVLHNAVNQKLINEGDTTKRIVPLEEARIIWNRPFDPSPPIPNQAD